MQYLAIDLKSFYASVECRERGLDPLNTNLVVADESRTEKTICLAVTPSLKAQGVSGRPRLFEVIQAVQGINAQRQHKLRVATGDYTAVLGEKSYLADKLEQDKSLTLDYIIAPPQMSLYIRYSTKIYNVYLKYIAPEDIHVYSIDEVFIDVTKYLNTYKMTAHELAITIIRDVLRTTGITATAGIGTNLYLAKIAMDIVAKKMPADSDGVRIAELDEMSYRKRLWAHKPLTAFWRVGRGYTEKLEQHGVYTMGDVARLSMSKYGEDLLYKLFGVNAELLIDHAWGYEPCTIEDVRQYRPETNCLSSGQVLSEPYPYDKARLVTMEMTDLLVLEIVEKKLVTNQITLTISYDRENLENADIRKNYHGEITLDHYGREVPKHGHGTENLGEYTSSSKRISAAMARLFDRIASPKFTVRKITVNANNLIPENAVVKAPPMQADLFSDFTAQDISQPDKNEEEREKKVQQAVIAIRNKYGKNAVLKGMNFEKGATARDRNSQIGGHKA